MGSDYLKNDEEDLISKFNGSYKRGLEERENTTKPDVPKQKKETKKHKETLIEKNPLLSGSIQIRVSQESLLLLKKYQMFEFEKLGKSRSLKEMLDSIVAYYFQENPIDKLT